MVMWGGMHTDLGLVMKDNLWSVRIFPLMVSLGSVKFFLKRHSCQEFINIKMYALSSLGSSK